MRDHRTARRLAVQEVPLVALGTAYAVKGCTVGGCALGEVVGKGEPFVALIAREIEVVCAVWDVGVALQS